MQNCIYYLRWTAVLIAATKSFWGETISVKYVISLPKYSSRRLCLNLKKETYPMVAKRNESHRMKCYTCNNASGRILLSNLIANRSGGTKKQPSSIMIINFLLPLNLSWQLRQPLSLLIKCLKLRIIPDAYKLRTRALTRTANLEQVRAFPLAPPTYQ